MALSYMVDTAATTWGPVYLDTTLDARVAALAVVVFAATCVVAVLGSR